MQGFVFSGLVSSEGLQDSLPCLSVRESRIKNYEAKIIYTASTKSNREESKQSSIRARHGASRRSGSGAQTNRRGWPRIKPGIGGNISDAECD